MALIFPSSTCVICDGPLDSAYTATSGCAFPEGHPLWRYCDSPLHLGCLGRWPQREQFSRGYFEMAVEQRCLGYGHILARGAAWALVCGPRAEGGLPYFADVRLADWPFRLYSKWGDWGDFIGGEYTEGLEGAALAAADMVMAEVREVAPDGAALERLLSAAT